MEASGGTIDTVARQLCVCTLIGGSLTDWGAVIAAGVNTALAQR